MHVKIAWYVYVMPYFIEKSTNYLVADVQTVIFCVNRWRLLLNFQLLLFYDKFALSFLNREESDLTIVSDL